MRQKKTITSNRLERLFTHIVKLFVSGFIFSMIITFSSCGTRNDLNRIPDQAQDIEINVQEPNDDKEDEMQNICKDTGDEFLETYNNISNDLDGDSRIDEINISAHGEIEAVHEENSDVFFSEIFLNINGTSELKSEFLSYSFEAEIIDIDVSDAQKEISVNGILDGIGDFSQIYAWFAP